MKRQRKGPVLCFLIRKRASWWYTLVIPALGKLRQDCGFKGSLGYSMSLFSRVGVGVPQSCYMAFYLDTFTQNTVVSTCKSEAFSHFQVARCQRETLFLQKGGVQKESLNPCHVTLLGLLIFSMLQINSGATENRMTQFP